MCVCVCVCFYQKERNVFVVKKLITFVQSIYKFNYDVIEVDIKRLLLRILYMN